MEVKISVQISQILKGRFPMVGCGENRSETMSLPSLKIGVPLAIIKRGIGLSISHCSESTIYVKDNSCDIIGGCRSQENN